MMMNKIIERYFGVIDANLQSVQAGSPVFQRKYKIFAQHESDISPRLSLGLEQILSAWQGTLPVVKITPQEMRIEVQGEHYKKEQDILSLVELARIIMGLWEK